MVHCKTNIHFWLSPLTLWQLTRTRALALTTLLAAVWA